MPKGSSIYYVRTGGGGGQDPIRVLGKGGHIWPKNVYMINGHP